MVQECAPVTYDENGNPCVAPDAKWDATAQYDRIKRRAKSNEEKTSIILVASSAIMLCSIDDWIYKSDSYIYMSDNYLAQIDIKSIGVTLTENGNDVSWRDYRHKDDDWSEATGVLGDMLKNAGDEKLILDKSTMRSLLSKLAAR